MTFKHGAIPTEYKGIRFRSRTEARWAAFFDAMGWKWEYEPYDLAGWIPDFAIKGKREVLVEVKPAGSYSELLPYIESPQLSRCPDGTFVLGSHPMWDAGPSPDEAVFGVELGVCDWILSSATAEEESLFLAFRSLIQARHGYAAAGEDEAMATFAKAHRIPFGRVVSPSPDLLGLCKCGNVMFGFGCSCPLNSYVSGSCRDATRRARDAWTYAQNATQWKGRGR